MKTIKLYNQEKRVIKNANLTVNYAPAKYQEEFDYVLDESLIAPYDIRVACEGYHSIFYRNQSSLPKELILVDENEPLHPASYFFDHQGFRINCRPNQDRILTIINFTDFPGLTNGVIEENQIIPAVNKFLMPLDLVVDRHFLGKEHMTRKLKNQPKSLRIEAVEKDTSESEGPDFELFLSPFLNVFIVKKVDDTDFATENDPSIIKLYQQPEVNLVGPYFLEDGDNSPFIAYRSEIDIWFDRKTEIKRIKEILTTENLEMINSSDMGSYIIQVAKIKPESGMGTGMNSLKIRLENLSEVLAVNFTIYSLISH